MSVAAQTVGHTPGEHSHTERLPHLDSAWFVLTLAAGYFVLAGAIPLLVLVTEFGLQDGLLCAKVHHHLFIYPLVFGWIGVASIGFPLRYAFSNTRAWEFRYFILVLVLIGVGVATYAEVTAPPAIWEAHRPNRIVAGGDPWPFFRNPGQEPDVGAKENFQNRITNLLKANGSSRTRVAYIVSFFVQAGYLTTLLLCLGFAAMAPRTQECEKCKMGASRVAAHLLVCLVFATVWLVMRMAFLGEKRRLCPVGPLPPLHDLIVVALFLCAYFYLLWTLVGWHGERLKHVFGILGGGSALIALLVHEQLVTIINRDTPVVTYVVMAIALVIALLPILTEFFTLRAPKGNSRPPAP